MSSRTRADPERGAALTTNSPTVNVLIFFAAIVAWSIIGALALLYAEQEVLAAIEWLRSLGMLGVASIVTLYVLSCIFLLPLSVLTPAMGIIYGVVAGVAVVSLGITLGAVSAFWIGRKLLRHRIEARVRTNAALSRINVAVSEHARSTLLLSRICLFVPFRVSNYVFSVSSVSFRSFLLYTWLGTIPTITLYVYAGSLLGSLVDIGKNGALSGLDWRLQLAAFLLSASILLGGSIWISKHVFPAEEAKS